MVPSLLSLALTAYQKYLSDRGEYLFYYTVEDRFPHHHYHELFATLSSLEYCNSCSLWVPQLNTYHILICHNSPHFDPGISNRDRRRLILTRMTRRPDVHECQDKD